MQIGAKWRVPGVRKTAHAQLPDVAIDFQMFKTAATKIAHNSTLPSLAGNKDLRPLQDLIIAEKAVLVSYVEQVASIFYSI
jgi:hypothetical protein